MPRLLSMANWPLAPNPKSCVKPRPYPRHLPSPVLHIIFLLAELWITESEALVSNGILVFVHFHVGHYFLWPKLTTGSFSGYINWANLHCPVSSCHNKTCLRPLFSWLDVIVRQKPKQKVLNQNPFSSVPGSDKLTLAGQNSCVLIWWPYMGMSVCYICKCQFK